MSNESNSFTRKVPFNSYDIFGYLIPGITFLLSVYFFEYWAKFLEIKTAVHTPIYTLVKKTIPTSEPNVWIPWLIYFVFFAIIAYVFGHIISSASSLLIDRILIYKGYGYPYEILLSNPDSRNNKYTKPYYRGLFFWINFYFLAVYFSNYTETRFFVLIHEFTGILILVVVFSKMLLETIRSIPKSSTYNYFKNKSGRWITSNVKRILLDFFPLFYNLSSTTISNYLRTQEPFDKDFIVKYNRAFKKKFNMDPKTSNSNNFWLTYCYVMDNSAILNKTVSNFLYLYSFSRNLAMAFYIAFLYSGGMLIFHYKMGSFSVNFIINIFPLVFFMFFVIMIIRYYYLYFSYFTKFIFRAFVYLEASTNKS